MLLNIRDVMTVDENRAITDDNSWTLTTIQREAGDGGRFWDSNPSNRKPNSRRNVSTAQNHGGKGDESSIYDMMV